jgi:hypothetical protein
LQTVLGVDMSEDELQVIYDHILAAGSSSSVSMDSVTKWWEQDIGSLDNEECDFRRAIRLRGIFASCKSSLLVLADPTESHLATRRLFQRINVVCDFHKEGRDRITVANLRVLTDDLGIDVDDDQLIQAINEMDPTKANNTIVGFHPFEEWWLHGVGMDQEDSAQHVSTLIHSMLRLCGLLMCAQGGTVFGIWNSSTAILGSEEMRVSVERALDKIARNADHHHFDHMIERLHVASLGGLLHRDDQIVLEGKSLNVFEPESAFRMMCYKLCTSIQFELFILFCIFINVVGLVMYAENTDSQGVDTNNNFFYINLIVAIIFTLEMLARMVATGLIYGRMAYLRLGWNVFDFIVVTSIWLVWLGEAVGWIADDSSIAFTLTAFRAFRTLRFFEGTRQIVATLGEAKGTLALVGALMIVLFTMFSVMGREAFAGALTRTCDAFIPYNYTDLCTGEIHVAASGGGHRRQLGGGATQGDLRDVFELSACADGGYCREDALRDECWAQEKPVWYTETRTTSCPLTLGCTLAEHGCYEIAPLPGPKWREHHIDKYGFDTMSMAALTIFQVTARDEWMRIANPIWETTLTTSWAAWPFFMVVFISMGLMCVNLFLASITLAYLDLQKEIRQEQAIRQAHESLIGALLAQSGGEQAAGVLARSMSSDDEESEQELSGARGWCQSFVTGQQGLNFDMFIIAIVIMNTITMAWESYRMSKGTAEFLGICELVFTVIYTFEATVKIGGLGPRGYFKKGLNRLDFFIVLTALLGYVVEFYVEKILADESEGSNAQTTAVLRVVRIFRVIRAARALRIGKVLFRSKAISQILSMAFSSVTAILSLLYMIFLTLIVSSISGVFLFDKCHRADTPHAVWTRGNYGHLGYAFLANFQLFTEDNWANIMFEYIECTHSYYMSLYFVVLFCTLNFILLVIFVSIFLDNFTLSEEGKRKKQIDLYVKSIGAEDKQLNLMDMKAVNMAVRLMYTGGGTLKKISPGLNINADRNWNPMRELPEDQIDRIMKFDEQVREFKEKGKYGESMEFPDIMQPEQAHIRGLAFELQLGLSELTDALGTVEGLVIKIKASEDVSLGCMELGHPLRTQMTAIVENSGFEYSVIISIALSGACLAFEGPFNHGDPAYPHSDTTHDLLVLSDLVFYTIFLIECVGKIIAYGFLDTPNAYLSSITNCFDFFVVIITSLDLVLWLAMDDPPPWLNLIRLMRSLRLVRLLEHIDGLNIMAQAIWRSLPACTAVMGMLVGNMLVFSIVGMNLFMGQMWYCKFDKSLDHSRCECAGNGIMVDETGKEQLHAVGLGDWTDDDGDSYIISCQCDRNYIGDNCEFLNGTMVNSTLVYEPAEPCAGDVADPLTCYNKVTTLYIPPDENGTTVTPMYPEEEWRLQFSDYGPWMPQVFNYDSFGSSLGSLVVLTTRQGWHELFYYATDVTEPDMPPIKDDNIIIAGVFHVLFIMINGFMLEELFIGMLVEIFSQTSGTVLLTENQKKWRYLQMYVFHFSETHPDPPKGSSLRLSCYKVVTHPNGPFQKAMIFVVMVNVMMLIYDDNAPVRRMEGQAAFDIFNDICVFIFTVEIVVESLAFGFTRYVKNNQYNPPIVLGLWIVCIHAHLQHSQSLNWAGTDWVQVFQCLRVWKLFEVLSHFSSLKKLVHTLRLAIPQVKNVFLLMFMVYFLFGIMAMKLYGDIDIDGEYQLAWIGETNNFSTVFMAMKLLFQITTGNPLPLMIQDIKYTAKLPGTALPFVFVFFILSNFIFLNVFIALLLENFEYNLEGEFAIEEVEVDQFKIDWDDSEYTSDEKEGADGMELSIGDLEAFMLEMLGPLSVVVETDPFWHNRLLLELDCDADDELENTKYAQQSQC